MTADPTPTTLSQWLGAAQHWRQQEQARRREGRWRAAQAARYEAERAEAKARECAADHLPDAGEMAEQAVPECTCSVENMHWLRCCKAQEAAQP